MFKKLLYLFIILLIASFVYNSYIKEEDDIKVFEIDENIETQNIVYDIGKNYEIEAARLVEDKQEEKSYFDKAKALFNNLKVSGQEAIVDKVNNMIIRGNILGENDIGWKFKTDEVRYDEDKDIFYSTSNVFAWHEENNMTLETDYYEAESDFNFNKLEGNVKFTSDDTIITCDRATYDQENEILRLYTDIVVTHTLDDGSEAILNFNSGFYNAERERFVIWGRYNMFYDGYVLSANNLTYYSETKNVDISDDVVLEKDELKVEAKRIYYEDELKIATITGPISGRKDEMRFFADRGIIFTDTEDSEFNGNIKIYNDDNSITCNKVVSIKADKDYIFTSKDKYGVIFTGEETVAKSSHAVFNEGSKILTIKNKLIVENDEDLGTGSNSIYDSKKKLGSVENFYGKNEDTEIKSNRLEFDLNTKTYYLIGDVVVYKDDYKITSQSCFIDEDGKIIEIEDEFLVVNEQEAINISGTGGKVSDNEKTIVINSSFYTQTDEYELSSTRAEIDYENDIVKLYDDVQFLYENENIEVYADKGIYKKDKSVELYENVNFIDPDNIITTNDFLYSYTEEKAYFNSEGLLNHNDSKYLVYFDAAVYDEKTGNILIEDFEGNTVLDDDDDESDQEGTEILMTSDTGKYFAGDKIFTMEGNAKVYMDDILLESSLLMYRDQTKIVSGDAPFTVSDKNMTGSFQRGTVNVETRELEAEEGVITTDEGDKISGDYVDGNYELKEFNFKGNLEAELSNGIIFIEESAKMFFEEIKKDEEFEVTRGEVTGDTEFIYQEMILTSDYLEIDNKEGVVFGDGNPKLNIYGDTDVIADYIFLDIEEGTGKMQNNVKITSNDEIVGITNTTADEAKLIYADQRLEVLGNVVMVNNENNSRIETQHGEIDLDTYQMRGIGNTRFKYFIQKKDEEEK